MTTVVICKDKNGLYKSFYCMGHAGFARKAGLFRKSQPDIVCAAVSALVIGTINSLEELAKEDISVSTNEVDGFIRCDFNGSLQEKSVFLLDSMVFSLENISKEYGDKYLTVKFEEV